uniref:ORF5 n=1 Tax=Carrot yellow leaf virus TaxID=656190 RepID=A0A0A0P4Z5_9CLOS|nr:ORF5 [Carrot yellow leaf virus]
MVVFGLDFGTTFSTISVLKEGEIYLLKQQNSPYIPTYIFLSEETAEVAYGYDAESLMYGRKVKGSFFRDLKRWVGCNEKNFEKYMSLLKPGYKVELSLFGSSDLKTVKMHSFNPEGNYSYSLPDLIASFVRCIVYDAELCFKTKCTGIICSVPAGYNSCQRSFMLECVTLSGYTCLHIINEPSAAAFSAASRLGPKDKFVLVYDFGGGTFDVSGVSVRNGTFGVRSSGGDMNLGGRDVDRSFVEKLYGKIGGLTPDYSLDVSALKERISSIGSPIVYQLPVGGEFRSVEVDSSDLAEVALPYIQKTIEIMTKVHNDYYSSVSSNDKVARSGKEKKETSDDGCVLITVGGSSYLPGLKGLLSAIPYVSRVIELPDARSSVAAGCAMYSLCLAKDSSMLLIDCASHHLSIPSYQCESIVLVPAGAPIPFSGRRTISLMNASATSSYNAILFEGDYSKCPMNERIYSSAIQLKDLGITAVRPVTCSITIELDVSSVGTITFKVKGEKGAEVTIGKDRMFDFSGCHSPTRSVMNLFNNVAERVVLNLVLTRTPEARSRLSLSEVDKLYNENRDYQLQILKKDYPSFNDVDTDVCRSLMGVFVQKILRGSRVERLPL